MMMTPAQMPVSQIPLPTELRTGEEASHACR